MTIDMDESKLRNAIRKLRERNAQLESSLTEAIGVIEEFEAKAPEIESMQEQLESLHGTIREGTHRQAFDDLATELRLDPDFADIVFDALKLDTSGDEPDLKVIKKALEGFVKGKESKLLLPEDESDEAEDEAEDESEESATDPEQAFRDIFSLAPATKEKAKPEAKGKTQAKPEAKDAPAKLGKGTPTGKLSKGEGAQRGSRDDHKLSTVEDQINAEFAATGRTDPFRIG